LASFAGWFGVAVGSFARFFVSDDRTNRPAIEPAILASGFVSKKAT
jgi:hypothetical protein